jgi:hypothetical protein
MIQINVAVPVNCPPNALIEAIAPDGRKIHCNPPPGLAAGAVFPVDIPAEEQNEEEMSVAWENVGSKRVTRQQVLDFAHQHAKHAYNVVHCNCKHFAYDFLCDVLETKKKYISFKEFSRDIESRYSTMAGHGNFAKFATSATMTVHPPRLSISEKKWPLTVHGSNRELGTICPTVVGRECWVFTEEGIGSCHAYPFQSTAAAISYVSRWKCCWVLMLEDGQEIKHGGYGLAHQTCRRNGREWLAKRQRPAIAIAPAPAPVHFVPAAKLGAADSGRELLRLALGSPAWT